jgi:hypothetical protein
MESLPDYGAYGRKTFKRWEVVTLARYSRVSHCKVVYGAQRKESLQREASRTQGIPIELSKHGHRASPPDGCFQDFLLLRPMSDLSETRYDMAPPLCIRAGWLGGPGRKQIILTGKLIDELKRHKRRRICVDGIDDHLY